MIRLHKLILIPFILILQLESCNVRPTQQPFTLTDTSIVVQATPDYQATINNLNPWPQEQTTDGILLLKIEEFVSNCYKPGEEIKIKLIFQNLTTKPLTLQSRFFVATNWSIIGDLYVRYYSDDNTPIYPPFIGHIETFLPRETYLEISGNNQIDIIISDNFPLTILSNNGMTDNLITPSPENYLLRVTYKNYDSRIMDEWVGSVTSNSLELCIK